MLCDQLRAWFCTYGAPDELSSDGGPPFQSHEYAQFLSNWGIHQRLSSAYFAQSNGRAELAVKTAKRILMSNTDSAGRLNNDSTARAFLNHRNTPVQDVGISPAMMLFGRPSRITSQGCGTLTQFAHSGKKYGNCGKKPWQSDTSAMQPTTTPTRKLSLPYKLVILSSYRIRQGIIPNAGTKQGGS